MKKELNAVSEETNWQWTLRNLIAIIITFLVVGVTVFIAIYMVIYNHSAGVDGKFDISFIGQTLLPLWGTWLGTVLAFYFGKANFEAASKVIKNMTPDEKIANLLVKDAMVPLVDIVVLNYDTEKSVSLKTILDYERFKPYNRFAVFDSNNIVKAMINRGTFFEFMYKKSSSPTQELTLDDLLKTDDANIKNTLNYDYCFVPINATVLDAKKKMDSIAECHNVFITLNGKATEPVLGLLTNNNILEIAKV